MKKFTEWTPELAYFLGWMITDGYASDQGIHIEIAKKDKEVLDYLHKWIPESSLLGPYSRIKNGKTTSSFRLTINGYEIKDLFADHWNIIPNKTGKERVPFDTPEEMMPHLFRGIFDGDGCVAKKARGDHECYFCSSSKDFVAEIRELHGGNEGRNVTTHRDSRLKKNGEPREEMYRWCFGAKEAVKLRDWMYQKGHYGMTRKKERMFSLFG